MEEKEFREKLIKALEHVNYMDKTDGYEERGIKTILSALKCGIIKPESNAQFDAYVMLQSLERKESGGE